MWRSASSPPPLLFLESHTRAMNDPLTDVQHQILRALPEGRDDARTAAELIQEVDLEQRDPTSYQLRQEIKTLIMEHGRPIGSCRHGYFVIETKDEFEACLDDLRLRKSGIQERIDALRRAYQRAEQEDPEDGETPSPPTLFDDTDLMT